MSCENFIRLNRTLTTISSNLRNSAKSIVDADRMRHFLIDCAATIFIAVGLFIGVAALWAGIIFVSIWSLLFMLGYLS